MTKGDLIAAMADSTGLSKQDAGKALESFIDNVSAALQKGEKTALLGFGTFSITERAARMGRNPATGQEIQISAKNVVKFKAASTLTEKMNG